MKTAAARILYHLGDIACRIGWHSAYSWLMLKSVDLDEAGIVWAKPKHQAPSA